MSEVVNILSALKVLDPHYEAIAQDLHQIETAFQQQEISLEERNLLLQEIRDIRAAQECAGNELAFKYVVQACNTLISLA